MARKLSGQLRPVLTIVGVRTTRLGRFQGKHRLVTSRQGAVRGIDLAGNL